ncbi:hypothetical protein M0R72_12880 [Candidatus Pacearchaeota archaeon]|nr:hypothetical protein [Candidatus Pacearchaeota archaeon]
MQLTTKRLVTALKKMPEKKFRISTLAAQIFDDKGKVDIVKAMDRQGELNLAIVEIQVYIKAVKAAREALDRIGRPRTRWDTPNTQQVDQEDM